MILVVKKNPGWNFTSFPIKTANEAYFCFL